jgi:diguanylate cyclase (GGDEF)-like protein
MRIDQVVRRVLGWVDGRASGLRAIAAQPVWGLNVIVLATAVILYAGAASSLPALARPHLPWWLVCALFAAAEVCVVHLHFRRGALSFSLGDIPLVLGLVFCSAQGVMLACVIGGGVVLGTLRRQPAIKLVFNIGQFAVSASIAALVVHALAGSGVPAGPRLWFAVLVAAECADLTTVLLIAGAIYLSERQLSGRTLARMLVTDGIVTLNNASLALCGVIVIRLDARALPLLVVPLGTLFIAYRAYLSQLERQKQLQFVHEANRTLTSPGEMARVLETLLDRSLQTFRAESVELVLFGQGDEPALRMAVGLSAPPGPLEPLLHENAVALRELVNDLPSARLVGPGDDGGVLHRLGHNRLKQGIAAPLRGEEHLVGAILLVNRLGAASTFAGDDLMLLDTLAANASAALQYDRLEAAVQQLTVAHDQLRHAASHDPLTGLVNRGGFTEQVEQALAEDPLGTALLFVDLDNFKTVNDTLGHASGDDLLITVASRLRACVRAGDVVARLGGDEFAIVVRAPGIIQTAAESVAQRVIRTCKIDVVRDDSSVTVHASVGVAVCTSCRTTRQELIHAADVAMYKAKTAGKGRYELFHSGGPSSA